MNSRSGKRLPGVVVVVVVVVVVDFEGVWGVWGGWGGWGVWGEECWGRSKVQTCAQAQNLEPLQHGKSSAMQVSEVCY